MKRIFHLAVFCCLALAPLLRAGETIDRIVAVVGGRPVMESDMVESLRVEQLLAAKPPQTASTEELRAVLGRLVDQLLLEQQMDFAKFQQPGAEEVGSRVKEIRTELLPSGADADWHNFLNRYDLNESDLAEHVGRQLRTVRFIDARFRPTVRLEPGAVETYYTQQLLPKMKQAGAKPVPMKEVEPKIREILTQQRMDDLLDSWLKTLRTQAEIRWPAPTSALIEADRAERGQSAGVR